VLVRDESAKLRAVGHLRNCGARASPCCNAFTESRTRPVEGQHLSLPTSTLYAEAVVPHGRPGNSTCANCTVIPAHAAPAAPWMSQTPTGMMLRW
jgi:hypothetical protein